MLGELRLARERAESATLSRDYFLASNGCGDPTRQLAADRPLPQQPL
jgi:hypothetical protein